MKNDDSGFRSSISGTTLKARQDQKKSALENRMTFFAETIYVDKGEIYSRFRGVDRGDATCTRLASTGAG
jgi:hypothetical protein